MASSSNAERSSSTNFPGLAIAALTVAGTELIANGEVHRLRKKLVKSSIKKWCLKKKVGVLRSKLQTANERAEDISNRRSIAVERADAQVAEEAEARAERDEIARNVSDVAWEAWLVLCHNRERDGSATLTKAQITTVMAALSSCKDTMEGMLSYDPDNEEVARLLNGGNDHERLGCFND